MIFQIKYLNEIKNIEINETHKRIGYIQDEILNKFSLMIYNIEYTKLVHKNGIIYFGNDTEEDDNMNTSYVQYFDIVLKNHNINLETIEYFEIEDRHRDENGNVIKNNKYIDNYNKYVTKKSEDEYDSYFENIIQQRNNENQNNLNMNTLNPNLMNILLNSMTPSISSIPLTPIIPSIPMNLSRNIRVQNNNVNQNGEITTWNIVTHPLNLSQNIRIQNNVVNNNVNENEENVENENVENENVENENVENENIEIRQNRITPSLTSIENNLINTIMSQLAEEFENENEEEEEEEDNSENNIFMHSSNEYRNVNFPNLPMHVTQLFGMMNSPYNNNGLFDFNNSFRMRYQFSNNLRNIFNGTLGPFGSTNMDDIKVTLTEEEYNNIETKKYNECCCSEENSKICIICNDEFKEDDVIKITKCKHVLHDECLKPWLLKESKKCPVCRMELGVGKAHIEEEEESKEDENSSNLEDVE